MQTKLRRFPKTRLSKVTLVAIGAALETSAAIHVMTSDDYEIVVGKRGGRKVRKKVVPIGGHRDPFVNSGHKAVADAVELLKRALRLPKDFSFTSERAIAWDRKMKGLERRSRERSIER